MIKPALRIEEHNLTLEVGFQPFQVVGGFRQFFVSIAEDIFKLRDFVAQVYGERGTVFTSAQADN